MSGKCFFFPRNRVCKCHKSTEAEAEATTNDNKDGKATARASSFTIDGSVFRTHTICTQGHVRFHSHQYQRMGLYTMRHLAFTSIFVERRFFASWFWRRAQFALRFSTCRSCLQSTKAASIIGISEGIKALGDPFMNF